MRIVAGDKHFRELNEEINTCPDAEIELDNVCGQRYICSGLSLSLIHISEPTRH